MPRLSWPRKARRPGAPTDGLPGPEEALATATELAEAGRAVEAVELLTDVNRAVRDRRVERRLVDLRSEAFLCAPRPASRPAWAPTVDRFPGTQLPEVARDDLSVDAVRSAIEHHGMLLVRGLIGRETVDRLVGDVDRALAAYDAHTEGADRPDLDGWYEPFARDHISNREQKRARGSILTVESPPTLFDLLEAFDDSGLSRVVKDYFAEAPMLLAGKGTLRRIAHGGNTGGWHQDGAFMGVDIRSLNVWLALTHCGDTAPGLDVVARRLTALVPTGEGAFAAWAANPEAAEATAAGALVRPVFEAGDALIFDHLNLHRTAIDPGMQHDRHAVETWLFAPSTYNSMTATREAGYSPRDQIPILF